MTHRQLLVSIVLVSLAVACGGGGSSDGGVTGGGGGTGTLATSFTPDEPNPGNDTVAMALGSTSGSAVTVAVNVTDTNGVYGAAFEVTFDSSLAQFSNWSQGTALEAGGATVSYIVDQPVAGRLVVGASRTGPVGPVNISGTQPLIRLTFVAAQPGTGAVSFQNGTLQDDTPQDLPNVVWAGGTLSAN